jgi:hypothetical protein
LIFITAAAAIALRSKIHEIRTCALGGSKWNHFERAMSLRNGSHFPSSQCACHVRISRILLGDNAMAAAAVKKILIARFVAQICRLLMRNSGDVKT